MVPMLKDRPSRNPLLFGVLLVVVVLAAMGLLSPDWGEQALEAPALAAGHSAGISRSADLQTPVPEMDTGRESTAMPPLEPSDPASEEASPEEEYPVRGTFVLTDCFGQEHTTLDGQFEVVTHFGEDRQSRIVEVWDGEFEFSVPDPSRFFVHDFALSDRVAELDIEKELTGPHHDQRLALRARDQCEVRLEIVDAKTGAHLSGVEIWSESDLESSARLLPLVEACDQVLQGGTSPILLPQVDLGWGTLRTYWVRAGEHAWGKVSVDHTHTGDYTVRLDTEASLAVLVKGLEGAGFGGLDPWLNLRRLEDNEILAYAMLERSFTHRWDGVPPGSYRVSVDLGYHWDDPLPLGSGEVSLGESEEASLVIEASPPEIPLGPVRVSGTVRVHEFWREQGFSMGFHGIGETERWEGLGRDIRFSDLAADVSDADLLHWSKELPCEGSWQVTVGHLGVHEDFEATVSGTRDIDITVQDPAELSIQVKDAETGHVLPGLHVWYAYAGKTRNRAIVWPNTEYQPESGRHRMHMPAGRALMRFSSEGYAEVEEELELTPGKQELTYELEPCARVDFEFIEGTVVVPVSRGRGP